MVTTGRMLPDPMLPRPYEVMIRRRETNDTYTLTLKPADDSESLAFLPGQFNMLYAFGIGEVPISISGDPCQNLRLVHTIRGVGASSRAICGLRRGAVLCIRGPFGSHWPIDEAFGQDVVIVTGGIGLAPLRPAIYQIISQREKFGRVHLLYGARSPSEMLYAREMEQWQRQGVEVKVTVDRGPDPWSGNVGVVTTLIPGVAFDSLNTVAMVCGPEVMMRFVVAELQTRGVADDRIYVSMERNMHCAIGLCGHCQYGPSFICKDGPVFPFDQLRERFVLREV